MSDLQGKIMRFLRIKKWKDMGVDEKLECLKRYSYQDSFHIIMLTLLFGFLVYILDMKGVI